MEFAELRERAKAVWGVRQLGPFTQVGSVAAALVTATGKVYTGVCIDAPCGMGFCAEHAAIAAMITAGESRIEKIVAVGEDGIMPPCGRCREFICQVDAHNQDTLVMVDEDTVLPMKELLPFQW